MAKDRIGINCGEAVFAEYTVCADVLFAHSGYLGIQRFGFVYSLLHDIHHLFRGQSQGGIGAILHLRQFRSAHRGHVLRIFRRQAGVFLSRFYQPVEICFIALIYQTITAFGTKGNR